MKRYLWLAVAPVLSIATASADDSWILGGYADDLDAATQQTVARIDKSKDPAACKDAVAKLRQSRAASVKLGARTGSVEDAAKLCNDYDHQFRLRAYSEEWERITSDIHLLTPQMAPGPDFVKKDLAIAGECRKHADELIAAGVPAELSFHPERNVTITVGEIKAKYCEALAKAAGQFTKDMAEATKKATERYTKLGVSGDRLNVMMTYAGSLFLVGGAAPDGLERYASAPVMFVWTTSSPDSDGYVVHRVRKYSFSGNKLASATEKTYRRKRGEKLSGVFQ